VVVINTAAVGTSGATNSDDGDNATSRATDMQLLVVTSMVVVVVVTM